MFKVGDTVELIHRDGYCASDKTTEVGVVVKYDTGFPYPIIVKWENGIRYGYKAEHLALVTFSLENE